MKRGTVLWSAANLHKQKPSVLQKSLIVSPTILKNELSLYSKATNKNSCHKINK